MDEKRRKIEEVIGDREGLELGVEVEEERLQFVIATLSGDLYAFSGRDVASIGKVRAITPIPGTGDHMLGVMYYQGQVESVLDLGPMLGLPATSVTRKSRVVFAAAGNSRTGILVDAVEDVVDLPASGIFAPLHTMEPQKREYVTGETEYRGTSVVILDVGRIFARLLEQGHGEP